MQNSPETRSSSDRWLDTILFTGLGCFFLWMASGGGSAVAGLIALFGVLCLVTGYASWRQTPWRRWVAIACWTILLAHAAWLLIAKGGSFFRWAVVICLPLTIWKELSEWLEERRIERQLKDTEGEGDEPMTSLVLLQRSLPYMDQRTLAELCSEAWGADYTSNDDDSPRFVVGDGGPFMVKSPEGMFIVHRVDNTYWNDMEGLLKEVRELRMLHLLQEHTAWMSVDLLSSTKPKGRTRESYYPQIAKLLVELASEETLAVIWPEKQLFAPWSAEAEAKLRAGNPEAVFEEQEFSPVVRVSGDDPRMVAAREEARRRWPEFAEAFKTRKPDEPSFIAKVGITREENTEYIWIEVIGIEPEYVHGKLLNQPVALGDLKEGDQVEAPLTELNDWVFPRNGEPVGGFTIAVLNEIQREAREGGKAGQPG